MKKNFVESPNFWLAVIILIGGFFIGFPTEAAGKAVAAVFALIGSGGIVLKFFRDKPKVAAKPWIQDANFWNYLSVVAISVAPGIAEAVLPAAQELTLQVMRGNYGGAIMGAVSLITIVLKLVKAQKDKEEAIEKLSKGS